MSAADLFAKHWIEAWNTHDIEAILSHYADDVVFLSPVALKREGIGRIVGHAALRAYWTAGLAAQPQLRFTLDKVLGGFDSLTLIYQNHRDQSVAETFEFDEAGKVVRAYACYA